MPASVLFSTPSVSRGLSRAFACAGLLMCASLTSVSALAAAPIKLSGTMAPGGNVSSSFGVDDIFIAVAGTPRRAVFLADRETNGVIELWSVPLTGGAPTKLSGTMVSGGSVSTVKMSPDGNFVAFSSNRVSTGKRELWLSPVDGSAAPVNLSNSALATGGVSQFDWSPNSQRVVFMADRDVAGNLDLYSVLTSGSLTKLSSAMTVGGLAVAEFKISNDSTRVVFRGDLSSDNVFELYSVPINGGSAFVRISGSFLAAASVNSFLLTPDSARAVFLMNRDDSAKVELYSNTLIAPSATPAKLSGFLVLGGDVTDIRVSANSQRAVFMAFKDSATTREVYSAPIDGVSGPALVKISGTMVAGGSALFSRLAVSTDSQRVVFIADKDLDGVLSLYVAPIATANAAVRLSEAPQVGISVDSFVISPDAQRVVFSMTSPAKLFSVPVNGGAVADLTAPTTAASAFLGTNVSATGYRIFGYEITPDSKSVITAFQRNSSTSRELFSLPVSGGAGTNLSGAIVASGTVSKAVISNDSTNVVFAADKDISNQRELYSVSANGGGAALDIDGDGQVLATTDGLMLMRYQLGIRGAGLIGGITFAGSATRTTAVAIEEHLRRLSDAATGW